MITLEQFFNLIGSFICHQLPSRTLYAGSIALPVCARDTGIYAGIFTGALFLLFMRRLKSQRIPGTRLSVLMCALMAPMILDGMLSYIGIFGTNNTTRLLTGALFGLPIPFFLVPAARFNAYSANSGEVLKNVTELLVAYALTLLLCFSLMKGLIPYMAAALIFVMGFLFLLSRISYTVLFRLARFGQMKLYAVTGFMTLSMLTLLYCISVNILQPLKDVLLRN